MGSSLERVAERHAEGEGGVVVGSVVAVAVQPFGAARREAEVPGPRVDPQPPFGPRAAEREPVPVLVGEKRRDGRGGHRSLVEVIAATDGPPLVEPSLEPHPELPDALVVLLDGLARHPRAPLKVDLEPGKSRPRSGSNGRLFPAQSRPGAGKKSTIGTRPCPRPPSIAPSGRRRRR